MDVKLSGIVKMLAIPLAFLKVSNLYAIPCGFYGYPNEQSWMCDLCMFTQILSHTHTLNLITIIATSLMCYT